MSCPSNCIGWDEDKLSMHDDITEAVAKRELAHGIAKLLMDRAGILFQSGDDDEAVRVRELSKLITEQAKHFDIMAEKAMSEFKDAYPRG